MKPYFAPHGAPAMSSRRLLLLSYHFPPSPAAGALRWQKLSSLAAERGWGVDVITLAPTQLRAPDWRRMDDLSPGIRVFGALHKTLRWERIDHGIGSLLRHLRRWRRQPPRAPTAGSAVAMTPTAPDFVVKDAIRWDLTRPQGYARAFHAWLHFAREREWSRAAFEVGRQVLTSGVHAAVITCGPPHMTHEAGWRLAAVGGVPFVMDMRDPWTAAPAVTTSFASPVWLHLAEHHERRAVERAALVVANTPQLCRAMQGTYPGARARMIAVMNGYDDDPLPPPHRSGRFTIAFAGSIYIDRDPRPLFGAAGRLVRTMRLTPEQFGIEFIGHVERYGGVPLAVLAEQAGLAGFVRIGGPRTREETMRFLAGATMLVSLPQDVGLAIPSKIFEYMRFPAWVLVLAERDSGTELLLRGTGADVVAPQDEAGIAMVLQRRFEAHARGEQPPCLAHDGRFSRREQARILFAALEAIVPLPERTVGMPVGPA